MKSREQVLDEARYAVGDAVGHLRALAAEDAELAKEDQAVLAISAEVLESVQGRLTTRYHQARGARYAAVA